jgi:hypothetical protein
MLRSVIWKLVQVRATERLEFGLAITTLYGVKKFSYRKRFRKFSNATGSPLTNAMFGMETPIGRTPFQGASLDATSPRAKAPDFAKPTWRLAFWRHLPQHEGRHSFSDGGLGYSVRPLRGQSKMSKLQEPPRRGGFGGKLGLKRLKHGVGLLPSL